MSGCDPCLCGILWMKKFIVSHQKRRAAVDIMTEATKRLKEVMMKESRSRCGGSSPPNVMEVKVLL